jgi:hypothetical protein
MGEDLTGRKFGFWTVIAYLDGMWLCRCECGLEKLHLGYTLRSGRSRGCQSCINKWNRNKRKSRAGIFTGDTHAAKYRPVPSLKKIPGWSE